MRNRSKLTQWGVVLLCAMASTFIIPAFSVRANAAGLDYVLELGGWVGESSWDKVYSVAKAIAVPLAGLCIVYGALLFFGVSIFSAKKVGRDTDKGKEIILWSFVALMLIFLLPIIFKLAVNSFVRVPRFGNSIPSTSTPAYGSEFHGQYSSTR